MITRIAILGAPSAGKSGIGSKLATALRASKGEKGKQTVKVVDGYIEDLIKNTGFAYAHHATHAQNYQIIFDRWTKEQEAAQSADTIITCGSIYESILWTAMRVNNDAYLSAEKRVAAEGRAMMEGLGVLERYVGDVDLVFFLPLTDAKKLKKGKSYEVVIDEKLPEVVTGFYRTMVYLTGNDKEKVERAVQVFNALQEYRNSEEGDQEDQASGTPVADQPRV